jgi:hypothetical protein
LEYDKARTIVESEAREKAEAEEKSVAEKEKDSVEASRIADRISSKRSRR